MFVKLGIFASFLLGISGHFTEIPEDFVTEISASDLDNIDVSSPKFSDSPYLDLTDAINQQNFTEIGSALNITPNIFYSTSRLVSDLPTLSWIAKHLEEYDNNDDSTSKICLMISFQITDPNSNDIDWRHISDVLDIRDPFNATLVGENNLQTLRKYLCKVVLDFQIDMNSYRKSSEYEFSREYSRKWDISFTKYTRDTINSIFGAETRDSIPIGVVYTLYQTMIRDRYLLEQEIANADFLILNMTLLSNYNMPLTYQYFEEQLQELTRWNKEYIGNLSAPTTFMITWRKYENICSNGSFCSYSDAAMDTVFNSSQPKLLSLLHKFVSLTQTYGAQNIDIISGTKLEIHTPHSPHERLNGKKCSKKFERLLAPLYIQPSVATPCQLRSMLNEIARSFDTLVVNEFTWSALARNIEHIANEDNSDCVSLSQSIKYPENIILMASEGIGKHWRKAGHSFERLVRENSNLGLMNISTVVFSGEDVVTASKLGYSGYNLSTGISKFVRDWVAEKKSLVGCLVDVTRLSPGDGIAERVNRACRFILQNSTLFVWKYKVDSVNDFYRHPDSIGTLVGMLVARAHFLRHFPDKEVAFMIETSNDYLGSNHLFLNDEDRDKYEQNFMRTLITWSRVHGVKVMYRPAFDLKYPSQGYFNPPLKDGSFLATNNTTRIY